MTVERHSGGGRDISHDSRSTQPTTAGVRAQIETTDYTEPCDTPRGVTMSDDWGIVGYVVSSKYRVLVLQRLIESPAPPSTIAEDMNSPVSHVSRALQELRSRDLVDLLVPESRKKGRIYGVTEKGSAVWETIESENLV